MGRLPVGSLTTEKLLEIYWCSARFAIQHADRVPCDMSFDARCPRLSNALRRRLGALLMELESEVDIQERRDVAMTHLMRFVALVEASQQVSAVGVVVAREDV